MSMEPRKLLYIEWLDHATDHGWKDWSDTEDVKVRHVCRSVGWVISENEDYLVLGANVNDMEHNLRSYLLRKCIINRVELDDPSQKDISKELEKVEEKIAKLEEKII
jgi:hypothetical protein